MSQNSFPLHWAFSSWISKADIWYERVGAYLVFCGCQMEDGFSWNCGSEKPLRKKQTYNAVTVLLILQSFTLDGVKWVNIDGTNRDTGVKTDWALWCYKPVIVNQWASPKHSVRYAAPVGCCWTWEGVGLSVCLLWAAQSCVARIKPIPKGSWDVPSAHGWRMSWCAHGVLLCMSRWLQTYVK